MIDPGNRARVSSFVDRFAPGLVPEAYAETTFGWAIEKTIGFRVRNEDELAGVDLAVHGEEAYELA